MPTKKRIQYRYTPTGQRSALIDPDGGRFTYSYDSVKRLTQVINPQGERTSYSYDAAGRRTVKKLANGSRTSFSYNAANRITSVAHLKSDTSVQASFSYQYDKAGNRTSLSEADGSRTTWSYDAAYQLTAEHRTGTNAYRNTYVYDNRGNRILKNLDGQRTTSTYDAANQLAWSQDASGRTTYTFDADGNQQVVLSPSGDRVTNLWDYENKLIGVQHPAGSRETMAYDPDGKRVMLEETAATTKYVWDEQNYLQETDAGDVTQVTYTNEPRTYGNLISQRKSSASHYYLFDALGSTRLVTDASQNISESLLYDAWGNLLTSAPTMVMPFRWVGELGYLFVPVTSDYYVRARVYQPGIGRWISRDPLRQIIGSHLFRYAKNRTSTIYDPSGLLEVVGTHASGPPIYKVAFMDVDSTEEFSRSDIGKCFFYGMHGHSWVDCPGDSRLRSSILLYNLKFDTVYPYNHLISDLNTIFLQCDSDACRHELNIIGDLILAAENGEPPGAPGPCWAFKDNFYAAMEESERTFACLELEVVTFDFDPPRHSFGWCAYGWSPLRRGYFDGHVMIKVTAHCPCEDLVFWLDAGWWYDGHIVGNIGGEDNVFIGDPYSEFGLPMPNPLDNETPK